MSQFELPLIMLHGALGNTQQLHYLAGVMAQKYYVYLIEFEGHGGNPSNDSMSIKRFVENVLVAMDRDGMEKADFFGHSMGGYVALQLALDHPERVGRIFTLGTKFDWNPEFAKKEKAKLNPDIILERFPAYAKRLEEMHHGADWKEVVRQTGDMMLRMGNGDRISEKDLKKVKVPVTVCVGEMDKMVTREETEHAADLIPNGRFILLPGVEHPIEKVDPNRIIPYLEEFLTVNTSNHS